jgi:alkylation response protein AidB-like acyl-CoA dehydrogenase
VLEADSTPRLGPDGQPVERTLLFPKASAELSDIWRVVGLKGTGSDMYAIDDLFVPDAYSYRREAASERRETGPLYRCFSNYQLYGTGFAAVALGLARASLDAFVALATTKTPYGKTALLRDNAQTPEPPSATAVKPSPARDAPKS